MNNLEKLAFVKYAVNTSGLMRLLQGAGVAAAPGIAGAGISGMLGGDLSGGAGAGYGAPMGAAAGGGAGFLAAILTALATAGRARGAGLRAPGAIGAQQFNKLSPWLTGGGATLGGLGGGRRGYAATE